MVRFIFSGLACFPASFNLLKFQNKITERTKTNWACITTVHVRFTYLYVWNAECWVFLFFFLNNFFSLSGSSDDSDIGLSDDEKPRKKTKAKARVGSDSDDEDGGEVSCLHPTPYIDVLV